MAAVIEEPLEQEDDRDFRRQSIPGERLRFALKLTLGPPGLIGAAVLVVYGALWVSFAPAWEKLWGLAMLLAGVTLASASMWFILDRPRQWFAPGHNVEVVPGRRTPSQVVRGLLRRR